MSGYSSRAEVVGVLKDTIRTDCNSLGLSTDPADYNIAGLVRDNFVNRGYWGWKATTDGEQFVRSLARHLRTR